MCTLREIISMYINFFFSFYIDAFQKWQNEIHAKKKRYSVKVRMDVAQTMGSQVWNVPNNTQLDTFDIIFV